MRHQLIPLLCQSCLTITPRSHAPCMIVRHASIAQHNHLLVLRRCSSSVPPVGFLHMTNALADFRLISSIALTGTLFLPSLLFLRFLVQNAANFLIFFSPPSLLDAEIFPQCCLTEVITVSVHPQTPKPSPHLLPCSNSTKHNRLHNHQTKRPLFR